MPNEPLTKIYPLKDVMSNTAFGELKKKHPNASFFIKNERENETGTHKDRSFKMWLSMLQQRGITGVVISSSGNSAISAAKFSEKVSSLDIFISPYLSKLKRQKLNNYLTNKIKVHEAAAPKKEAFRYSKEKDLYFLRASSDNDALTGYEDISKELVSQLDTVNAMFIPVSSGSATEGIFNGFSKYNKNGFMPAFYVAQVSGCHPISEEFDDRALSEERSLADSITDRIALRKKKIVHIVRSSGGDGFTISNGELENVKKELAPEWFGLGFETLLTIVSLKRASKPLTGNVVCLATS